MSLYILGICGTFMASVAYLAKQLGYDVAGCDDNVYPPMSTFLEEHQITYHKGFNIDHLEHESPQTFIVGNVMTRGNTMVEHILNNKLNYVSGPQWLHQEVLAKRRVTAVSGTHGKTTTTAILEWLLNYAGKDPGYLIGGISKGTNKSANLGSGQDFIVEADEYDCAFFDKRAKFVHYHPHMLIITNIEFDHADIYPDVDAIMRQFHHLIRTIPANGLIIAPTDDTNTAKTLALGCWTPVVGFSLVHNEEPLDNTPSPNWRAKIHDDAGMSFSIMPPTNNLTTPANSYEVAWQHAGKHNVANALAATIAAHNLGVPIDQCCQGLNTFPGVKRRMEKRGKINNITVYDDFAHHPTAIRASLEALRAQVGSNNRIIAIIEPRSNTMKAGIQKQLLSDATTSADLVMWYHPANIEWDLSSAVDTSLATTSIYSSLETLSQDAVNKAKAGDHLLLMSNGSFGGLHQRLINELASHHKTLN